MYIYQWTWSHCWLHWVHKRPIYWHSCLIYTHELVGKQGLYVALQGNISFWHVHGSNMFPVTWCSWCHQWHHCIFHVEMVVRRYYIMVWKYYMAYGTSPSSSADIIVKCYWWWYWCHVMLMPMASNGQESYVATNFNHLDLRNPVVPLMIPLASCAANANGIMIPKMSHCMSFQSSWCKECSGTFDDANGIMWPK